MITGAHAILYSTNAEADRAFLRDVLAFPHVDAGEGWLIFGLPPAEVAVHPGEENDVHEFTLMCDDVEALVRELGKRGVTCTGIRSLGWGRLTQIALPGGGRLGVYEPRHARPKAAVVRKAPAPRRLASPGRRAGKPARRPPAKRGARRTG